jgi:hypothetical protein
MTSTFSAVLTRGGGDIILHDALTFVHGSTFVWRDCTVSVPMKEINVYVAHTTFMTLATMDTEQEH